MIESTRSGRPDLTFEAIEATISETMRGRWFLAEHARRSRTADTELLLAALARIERSVGARHVGPDESQLRASLRDMAADLARCTKDLRPPAGDPEAQGAGDSLSGAAEEATTSILDAAEDIQDAAFLLRDRGSPEGLCDTLDERATRIYAACAALDGLTRRIAGLAETLASAEAGLSALTVETPERDPTPYELLAPPETDRRLPSPRGGSPEPYGRR